MSEPAPLNVRHVMIADPVTVPPDRSVRQVIGLMNDHGIGAVLVTSSGRAVGIFTERDLLRHAATAPAGWSAGPVSEWMTRDPAGVDPDCGWEEAVALMEDLRVRHLPVIEKGLCVGIVSARQLIARREEHLNALVEERTRELTAANALLTAREADARRTMAVAGKLQARLFLPHAPPDCPEASWGVLYKPLDPLGGDTYDFAQPDGRHAGVFIADASGHSAPAAMVAIMTRFAFAEAARETHRPGRVLAEINRRLQGLAEERFVTAFYGVLDRVTRTFTFANAGHPHPLLYAAGEVVPLAAHGLMLGVLPELVPEERTVSLAPGDRLCLFTDGVVECRDPADRIFGADRLREWLHAAGGRSPERLVRGLAGTIDEFRGGRPVGDDLTALVGLIA